VTSLYLGRLSLLYTQTFGVVSALVTKYKKKNGSHSKASCSIFSSQREVKNFFLGGLYFDVSDISSIRVFTFKIVSASMNSFYFCAPRRGFVLFDGRNTSLLDIFVIHPTSIG